MAMFNGAMVMSLLPEIGLFLLAAVLLAIGLVKRPTWNEHLDWITAGGFVLIAVVAAIFTPAAAEPQLLWGGMIRVDAAGFFFRLVVLTGGALTAVFSRVDDSVSRNVEFYLLLVLSSIGLSLMAVSGSLIMLYLAVETASIPLYVLAGFKLKDERSVESGIKYFLFGGVSSSLMLYGFSLLYGFAGTTRIYGMKAAMDASQAPVAGVLLAGLLVLAGFTYKISAVPFHFWAPDVYEGSPASVAGYLSTVSKAVGFAALMRVFINAFGMQLTSPWMLVLAVVATGTMFNGNLLAIPQKNLKRLIAYSSIAQAGYILVGVAAGTSLGLSGAIYYLLSYLVTNLAVFAIIGWVEKTTGSTDLDAFSGLSRRSPGMALLMMMALLSLGGIPPFAGFFSKVLVFGAAVEAGMAWLAIVGILNSVVGLYYYLKVMKVMYLEQPAGEIQVQKFPVLWAIALAVCVIGVVLFGVIYAPWFGFITQAATGL